MDHEQLLWLYRIILMAREGEQLEQDLTSRGDAFFNISGAGHESTATLARHLGPHDWLHCHYRDRALLLARGITLRHLFDNFYGKDQSSGRGRRMSPFLSDPRLNILSMVAPTANNALQSVGVAAAVRDRDERPLVYCSVGDGTTQQGEWLEACAEAAREKSPVLFVVQDNHWAISSPTQGRTFFSLSSGTARDLFGIPIHYVDGRDPVTTDQGWTDIVGRIRRDRGPQLVVLEVERLASHTNADDQTVYRSEQEILEASESGDPLRRLEEHLLESGLSRSDLEVIRAEVKAEVIAAEAESAAGPEPVPQTTAKRQLPVEVTHPSREIHGNPDESTLTMRDAMREVLGNHLDDDERIFLYGEDIEDPKGDVFGVTRGLSTRFPGRVCNSPLAESTIIGAATGRALAGQRPVAFLQFADFMPMAFNQIACELATLHWRTDGQWSAPVIVMMACGGYRPGLGPYHAQTFESLLAHIPGLDVLMPSNAEDAAGLLNAAFKSARPTFFLYPKSCLNDSQRIARAAANTHFVPIGPARKARSGRDLTLVGWGHTVRHCEQVAETLEPIGVEVEVIDLRSISPWDEQMVLRSAEKTARMIVVHEDNQTCGFAAEILATVAQKTRVPVSMRRVTRPDTFVPCNFANQLEILPSYRQLLSVAAELLDLDLSWTPLQEAEAGTYFVKAIGSGPADETVEIVEIHVEPGMAVDQDEVLATVEAAKSVVDITSPVAGQVGALLAEAGQSIAVGAPLIKLHVESEQQRRRPVTQEQPGTPQLKRRRKSTSALQIPVQAGEHLAFEVGISAVTTIAGSRVVTNSDLVRTGGQMSADDILRRTGIETRQWVCDGETAITMSIRACRRLLERENLSIDDLDLVICSTTSPTSVTPSMACRVLNGLARGKTDAQVQAFDINAACSGYLYALQSGYDFLQSTPNGRILVITAEVLSPLLNPEDLDTSILFGDATSATLMYGEAHLERAVWKLRRPQLSAKAEDGSTLSVPLIHDGFIQMKGRKVFSEAVRAMVSSLNRACDRSEIGIDDLRMIVPHQANQRILDAVQSRIVTPVYSNIRFRGNTSSTSIPLCLEELLPQVSRGDRLGLCAFGGGFTFGAGIIETN
jgi:2-oxoisovalerate dehydrogenase E1 component